ncbi:glycosyltransferase family 39 protein [bacterium]|nr:glycosyltransferase family 39 protein [bacterium]
MFEKHTILRMVRHPLFYFIFIALGLRLFRVELRSIWLDEAYSLVLASADWQGIFRGAATDIHPPFFYVLLGGWIRIFGTTEFALRTFSAFFGAALVPLVFILTRDWAGRRAAWWAAGLVSVSPYFVELSRSGRMGSMLVFFSVLSVMFFWRLLRKPDFFNSLGYCFATLAAMYTHYFAFLVFASQHSYIFMGIGKLNLSREIRKNWFLLQMFLMIGFAPWLPTLWDHISKGGPAWRGAGAAWWEPLHSLYVFWAGTACWTGMHKILFLAFFGAAMVLILQACLPRIRNCFMLVKPRVWGMGLTLVFVPLGLVWGYSSGKLNVFDNRYLSISALSLIIFSAVVIAGLPAIRRRWVGVLMLAAVSVPLLNQFFVDGYYDDWRRIAAEISSQPGREDIVAVYPAWNAIPLNYYLEDSIPIQGIPGNYTPITGRSEHFFNIDPENMDQLQSVFPERKALWLVIVNAGLEQTLIHDWFVGQYEKKFEKRFQSIYLMRFEKEE